MSDEFNEIAITLDLEWAPDLVLNDVFDLLNQYDIQATMFSTHDDSFNLSEHERGIHPNFEKQMNTDEILNELCSLYPRSVGLRSHKMFINTPLRSQFVKHGIKYESNYMSYLEREITPYMMPEGTMEFPVYWMDDIWFRQDGEKLSVADLLEPPGLKVFDFHPPHVCFNTPSSEYYAEHKQSYWDKKVDITKYRYDGYGVRELFISILEYIHDHGIETHTLGGLFKKYK